MLQFYQDFINRFVKPIVDIQPGERRKTFLMFAYFFIIIGMNWMLKPVQKALYLAEFGAENLKYANIAEGIFLIFIVGLYVNVAKRLSRNFFNHSVILFFLFSFIVFWGLFKLHVPYLPAFFFLWQASFIITLTTAFWTLANDLFSADQAKRLFGIIISGGSLGGVAGAFVTNQVVRWINAEDILLIAAALLGSIFFIVHALLQIDVAKDTSHQIKQSQNEKSQKSALSILASSKYLLLLAGLIMITKMASTIVDNQFSGMVEQTFENKEAMAAFFGQFGMWVNSLSFFMQIFATSIFLRYFGVGFSIGFLPVGLGAISVLTIFSPALWVSVCYRLFDLSGNYSVQQATKEIFYLPISSFTRRRIKPIIDMLCYRASKSFAGIFMTIFGSLFSIPVVGYGWLILLLLPLWLWIVWEMRGSYKQAELDARNNEDNK
jgi:AAA family ATP:ADP antiporter